MQMRVQFKQALFFFFKDAFVLRFIEGLNVCGFRPSRVLPFLSFKLKRIINVFAHDDYAKIDLHPCKARNGNIPALLRPAKFLVTFKDSVKY